MTKAGKRRRRRVLSEAEVISDSQKFLKALRDHARDLGISVPPLALNVGCELAELWNEKRARTVAHVGCKPKTICLAQAFGRLNRNKRYGILAHEVGHIMAGLEGPGAEPRADSWMRERLGIDILYDSEDTVEFLPEKTIMGLGL